MRYGVVISFNTEKKIGVVKDNTTNITYGFKKVDCPHDVEILDEVAFEVTTEKSKMNAINVKPS